MIELTQIVDIIKKCLLANKETLSLHEPCFVGNEWKYVKECLDTGWVSSAGKYVDLFEKRLAEFTGAKQAIAVVNGTAALHIALKLVGVESGDEVLIPALTFVATANAVSYCNAVPHLVDSETRTLGLDPFKLADYLKEITIIKGGQCFNKFTDRRIKAVVPMHTFGHPVDMDPLMDVAQKFCLEVVEDAAESLGSFYKERHTGNWGKVSALSFNGNKIITTGGGGAILTNDEELGKLAKHLTTTAKTPHKWAYYHDTTGYNYRLPNINAALGCAQLEQLPQFIEKKRELAKYYQNAFLSINGVTIFEEPYFGKSNYWLNVLLLDSSKVHLRDELLKLTHEEGILTRPAWDLMSTLPMYKDSPQMDLKVAERIYEQLINLPSGLDLGEIA